MSDVLGGTYDTGALSVTNGSPNVEIVGALLTTQAIRGDWIFVPAVGQVAFIEEVVDDENLVLTFDWGATTQVAADYLLIKMSWSRYNPAITQQKIRELLTYYEGIGFFYFVEGDEPDDGIGREDQFALKVNEGPWKLWVYRSGLWVLQGSPAGINPTGPWVIGTTYVMNDMVSWQGSSYVSRIAGNVGHQPDSSPTQWALLASSGDRYDIQFFDTDRPASGELVNKLFPVGVSFAVGVSQSYAKAETASTGTVYYSFKKNGTEFARLTFTAGNVVGVFSCPTATSFALGDVFTQYAPASRDETLSGVGGNLIGYRS